MRELELDSGFSGPELVGLDVSLEKPPSGDSPLLTQTPWLHNGSSAGHPDTGSTVHQQGKRFDHGLQAWRNVKTLYSQHPDPHVLGTMSQSGSGHPHWQSQEIPSACQEGVQFQLHVDESGTDGADTEVSLGTLGISDMLADEDADDWVAAVAYWR